MGRTACRARERTVRSACFPGTSDPSDRVEPERAGTAERRELERVRGGERVRPPLARARARRSPRASRRTCRTRVSTRGCRSRCRRGCPPPAARASGATPQPSIRVRPRAVRDRDVVLGEQRDLLGVRLHAVRRDHVRVQEAGLRERADPGRARRRDEHLREGLPGAAAASAGTRSPTRSPRDASRRAARARQQAR